MDSMVGGAQKYVLGRTLNAIFQTCGTSLGASRAIRQGNTTASRLPHRTIIIGGGRTRTEKIIGRCCAARRPSRISCERSGYWDIGDALLVHTNPASRKSRFTLMCTRRTSRRIWLVNAGQPGRVSSDHMKTSFTAPRAGLKATLGTASVREAITGRYIAT